MSQREGDVYMTGICAPSGLHSVCCGAVPLVRFSTSGPLYWFANDWGQGLEINQDEATVEEASSAPLRVTGLPGGLPPQAKFVDHMHLYPTPSAFIKALVAELPPHESLTRDQLLFVVGFAEACDNAFEDADKPAAERRTQHFLLLGQGGSGKTYVIQHIIFKAVLFLWPCTDQNSPTLVVVAASNAQARNISTKDVTARTLHNASSMRVQKYLNGSMGVKNKGVQLQRFWSDV